MLARSHSSYIEGFERGKGATDEYPMYKAEYAIGKSFYDLYWSSARLYGSFKSTALPGIGSGLVAGAVTLVAAPVFTAAAVGVVASLISGAIGHSLYVRSQKRLNMGPTESREKLDEVAYNNVGPNGEEAPLTMDILGIKAIRSDFTYFLDGLFSSTYAITNGKQGRDSLSYITGIGAFVSGIAGVSGIATGAVDMGALLLGAAGITAVGVAGAAIGGGLLTLALVQPDSMSKVYGVAAAGGLASGALATAAAVSGGLVSMSAVTTLAIAATALTGGAVALGALAILAGNLWGEKQFKYNYDNLANKGKFRNGVLPKEDLTDHIIRAF